MTRQNTEFISTKNSPSEIFKMPLVKIDVIKGTRTREEIEKLGATIQQVMIKCFGAPRRDRYQAVISASHTHYT